MLIDQIPINTLRRSTDKDSVDASVNQWRIGSSRRILLIVNDLGGPCRCRAAHATVSESVGQSGRLGVFHVEHRRWLSVVTCLATPDLVLIRSTAPLALDDQAP